MTEDVKAARLEVEILAFDEVLTPHHEATVTLDATLRDGSEKRFARTFSSQVAIADGDAAAVAESMGKALDAVVGKVAAAAAQALAPHPTTPARARRK